MNEPTRFDERRLEHIGEQGKYRVQRLELGRFLVLILNTGEELAEDNEVQNKRSREKGILSKMVRRQK